MEFHKYIHVQCMLHVYMYVTNNKLHKKYILQNWVYTNIINAKCEITHVAKFS